MSRYYKLLTKLFLAAIILCTTNTALGQMDSASNAVMELLKMQSRYLDAVNLSFDVKFLSTQKDSTGLYVTDSIFGVYKVSGPNLWAIVDSVEQIQNEQYTVTNYLADSTLFISKPDVNPKTVFPHNFLDSTFLQYEVSRMAISNNGGVQKRLTMFFNTESPYLSYDLYYDSTTYLINKLEYKLKDNSDYIKITLVFGNYQTTVIDQTVFSTSKYFTERDRKYIITQAYRNYQLINPSNEIGYEPQ